jgi:hypothetical protein
MKQIFKAPVFVSPRGKYKNAYAFMRVAVVACLFFSLASCSLPGPDIDTPELMNERSPKATNVPTPEETVRGREEPPMVTLQLGKSMRQTNLRPSEELPLNVKIGATNLNNVPLSAALQAVMADTDIALLWENPELQDRPVTLMNLKGRLPLVVERICRAAKVICAYRNGSLELMSEDTFVVELPPIAGQISDSGAAAGAANTIIDAIESLVEGKVKADSSGGNLIYTTNAEGHERVQSYLEQLRNGRPLIVLQLYIWEVQLESTKALGVNWTGLKLPQFGGLTNNLNLNSSAAAISSVAATQGVSLGAVFSGAIDANILARFLSTQGKVQNISSPQLTFVSGTSAKFEIGGSQRYISQVGTQNTVAGTGNTANSVVSTEEIKTGLTVAANGSYDNGVVFATLELKTSDVSKFESFPAGTLDLKLPITADRTVQTVLRVRPGDNLVLAGLQTSRDERNREGLPTFISGDLPTSGSNSVDNSELVIMVRPSVVFFNDRDSLDLRKVAEEKDGKIDQELAKPAKTEPVVVESIHPPSPLQSEFGTVVKLYEDTQIVVKKPVAAVANDDLAEHITPNTQIREVP